MNQPTEEPEPADALAALERFVVENDELQQLEEAIGRFNIFDSLGIARVEIRHSNFLAWLLDPAESHGQGSLFLRTLLMDLLRKAPAHLRPISPIELDGGELRDVEILREWHNIDLLIVCRQPSLLVAIENKIDSGEHSNQLQRYEDAIAAHFQDFVAKRKVLFAFLTRQGTIHRTRTGSLTAMPTFIRFCSARGVYTPIQSGMMLSHSSIITFA